MNDWKHKDIWKRSGTNFLIEVSRHEEAPSQINRSEGVNRWAVYAYIYPAHPHFVKFNGLDMWQEACTELPGHSYPSYLRYHRSAEGNLTSIQVGWDYHHDGDDSYTHDVTQQDASTQFYDAQRIHDRLEAMCVGAAQGIVGAAESGSASSPTVPPQSPVTTKE